MGCPWNWQWEGSLPEGKVEPGLVGGQRLEKIQKEGGRKITRDDPELGTQKAPGMGDRQQEAGWVLAATGSSLPLRGGASGSFGEGSREGAGDAERVCRHGQGMAFTEALGETLLCASGSVAVSLALTELFFIDLPCFVWLSSYILQLLKRDSAAKGPWWGGGLLVGRWWACDSLWCSAILVVRGEGSVCVCVCVSVWDSPKQTHSLILCLCLLCLQEIRST